MYGRMVNTCGEIITCTHQLLGSFEAKKSEGEGRMVDGHGESSDAMDPKSLVGHVYRWYMMGRRHGRLFEQRKKG
jgi:hypothetical protein